MVKARCKIMTVKQLITTLENLPDDLNVVVDACDFGQDIIKSVKAVDMYKGKTSHGEVYYERNDFFMGKDTATEKVVYLSANT